MDLDTFPCHVNLPAARIGSDRHTSSPFLRTLVALRCLCKVCQHPRRPPYAARIEFEKAYGNPGDHSELKRERWTASVTYGFRENVRNEKR